MAIDKSQPQNLLLRHFAEEAVRPWRESLTASYKEIERLDQYAVDLEGVLRRFMTDLLGVNIPPGEAVLATAKRVLVEQDLETRLITLAGNTVEKIPGLPATASEVKLDVAPTTEDEPSPRRRSWMDNFREPPPK